MKAILLDPKAAPDLINIDNSLEALQEQVGGYIEVLALGPETIAVFNEMGLGLGLPRNREASAICGRPIVGPCLILGAESDGEMKDVPQAAIRVVFGNDAALHA